MTQSCRKIYHTWSIWARKWCNIADNPTNKELVLLTGAICWLFFRLPMHHDQQPLTAEVLKVMVSWRSDGIGWDGLLEKDTSSDPKGWGVIVASWKFHENLLFNTWYFRREIIYAWGMVHWHILPCLTTRGYEFWNNGFSICKQRP